ncbi:hypothetical protein BG005_008451 [Podila minutissima]|nr:hypothetical protein BG005_008451 [Podila minutissima]
MAKFMEIRLENAFTGQSSDPKLQRLIFPWTGTQGPFINGKLIINHREDITLRGLTLTFTATISCSWSEKRGGSTAYFAAKKPLMEKSWVFLERADNKMHMLRANQTYAYDFQLALPTNLPNSLSMGSGKIEYKFSANGKRPTFSLDLDRERIVEIYQSLPPQHSHCLYPIQQTADWEQAMNYLIQIPKRAFHHGSALPITVRMHPLIGSVARWHVKDMSMKVKEYFWFISPGQGTRHEKRTILESKQGSGSWPIQTGPVERTLSLTIPATNIMTTVDTEIVKCSHKLKLMFHIDLNGSTRKLPVEFDLYIPGPFPPGQGPLGLPSVQQPLTLVPQVQQPLPPLLQMQQLPLQYQQPLPALPPQQQPLPALPYQQQPLPPVQHPPLHHAPPPPAQSPYGPGYPVMSHYMAPPPAPIAPPPLQTPALSPLTYSAGSQTPSSTYSQSQAYNPFSPPVTPYQPTTAATGQSTPGSTAAPHPYSQGYPTPTAAHAYPSVSSQGYPTPGLPPMPSPKVPSYPLPPSPSPMAAAAASGIQMPVPSSIPAHSAVSPPPTQVKTPVMSHQLQQQQQHFPVSPVRTTSTSTTNNSITAPKITAPPVAVASAVVTKVINDDIKVDVEDFKIPSIPSTPAMSATSPNGGASQTPPPSGSSGSVSGPASQTHSQNPQTQQVLPSRNPQQRHSFGALGADPLNSGNSYQPPPLTTSTQPHGPHAIKTVDSDINTQYSYHPPPPSSTMSSLAGSNGVPSPKNTHTHNATLEHRFSQMGFANSPPPPSPATSSTALVTSPVMSSPLSRPGASLSHSTSVSSTYPLSPVSAAATGAVVAHHQQQQQQQQYQPPPPPPVASMPPPSQHQQYQHQQPVMPSQHHIPQQPPVQQQPPPQKQQVWIPMYQTLGGKTYVQYVLSA